MGRAKRSLVIRESTASHSLRSQIHTPTPTRSAARFTLSSPNFFRPRRKPVRRLSPKYISPHKTQYTIYLFGTLLLSCSVLCSVPFSKGKHRIWFNCCFELVLGWGQNLAAKSEFFWYFYNSYLRLQVCVEPSDF